MLLIDENVTDA